ncbi:MAG: type sorting protein, partial [Mucilaginibacter sp.]|nr:type sorting protein [Mucilaginibacter sp.]
TDMINFSTDQTGGASFYTINCGDPINSGTPACISGLGTNITISWCKPGSNVVKYTITAFTAVTVSSNLNLRTGCTGTMTVNGLSQSSVSWTSIYPGATGAYNNYLSATSGATTVTVTPQAGAPPYIDYKVSGNRTICASADATTIRVYTYPVLNVSITPSSTIICSGAPVTLTAVPTGGAPSYTYLWNTGETTSSISASTAGTYTVAVNDQTSCGPVTQQVNVTAIAAPTVAPATICSGNSAILTATAPGGSYQWYDAPTNGLLLSSSASYTTPSLTTNTTYYVQTTSGSCTTSRTPVTVTVIPLPAKPAIVP